MSDKLRAILWIAVSSAPQADETKESLPEQERVLRAAAERNGWRIVDVIIVPGHSRDYYTYAEFCEGVRQDRKLNTDAPSRMWRHWANRSFDVFAVMDGSRFGRKSSIINEVVGRIYDAGAQIWSNKDGWVERNNKRWYAAMVGMQSEGEVEELVRRRRMGMKRRAQEGLPISSHVSFGHKLITVGKNQQRMVVDEDKRRLFDDLATLIIEGVGLVKIEVELFSRFGHGKDGKPYPQCKFAVLLRTPTFWGHSVLDMGQHNRERAATWMWDENVAPPPGISIFRNTHPPVYTGELAKRIRAELERRYDVQHGRARPLYGRRYSGLMICAECSYNLVYIRATPSPHQPRPIPLYEYYRCTSRYRWKMSCTNTESLTVPDLNKLFDRLLRTVLQVGDLNTALRILDLEFESELDTLAELDRIEVEIEEQQSAIRRLITKQASAPVQVQNLYDDEITQRGAQIAALQYRHTQIAARQDHNSRAQEAIADLQAITIDGFWELDEQKQNQMLHRLFGRKRLVVLKGRIIKAVTSQKRREKSRDIFDSD